MSPYYKESVKRATMKYDKSKVAHIYLYYQNAIYDSEIKTAAEAAGLPVTTYMKQAVMEKLVRDGLFTDEELQALYDSGLLSEEKTNTENG